MGWIKFNWGRLDKLSGAGPATIALLSIATGAPSCKRTDEVHTGDVELPRKSAEPSLIYPAPDRELKRPAIEVKDGHLTFEGKELRIGENVDEWNRTIGQSCRKDGPYTGVCAWDALGIYAHEEARTDNVASLSVRLSPRALEAPGSPQHLFSGEVLIDGHPLRAGMSIEEFNRNPEAPGKFLCSRGIRVCHLEYAGASFGAKVYASVGRNKQTDPILDIDISVPRHDN